MYLHCYLILGRHLVFHPQVDMIYHLWSGVCFMWWHLMNYWYLLGHYCHLYGKIRQNQVFWRPFCLYADIWKCPMLTESQQLTCWNWWSKEAKSIEKQTIVNKNKVDWAGCWTMTLAFVAWAWPCYFNTHLANNSIKRQGPLIWSSVPQNIRDSTSVFSFKTKLKAELISRY